LLSELPETGMRLSEIEHQIIACRLSGISFCQLSEKDIRITTDKIILNAAAITGCPTPETEFFAEILSEQIAIYIDQFGFGELTYDEIILAFRLNTKGGLRHPSGLEIERVDFFGSCFNVDYLSKILSNYMTVRNYLDRKFENFIDGYE